jgi:sugar phosphate isomerase/epimerase
MEIKIGNAPSSWGVEFPNDPRNPPWQRVLDECKAAGYSGVEQECDPQGQNSPINDAEANREFLKSIGF